MKKILVVVAIFSLVFTACKCDDCEPVDCTTSIPSEDLQWILDNTTPYNYGVLPSFAPTPTAPNDNPTTEEGVALGRHLFYEPLLSGDNTLSCSGCHNQQNAMSDMNQFSVGIDGILGTRQSMALFNLDFGADGFFWDGRAKTIEQQTVEPVANPIEMHEEWTNAISELQATELYPPMFAAAFGSETINVDRATKALAQFLRSIVSFNSKYDLALTPGTGVSFTEQEERGRLLFENENGQCFHCHSAGPAIFSDGRFVNNGLDEAATIYDFEDEGLGGVTGNSEDYGKFKVPSLRNLDFSAPYMHDGRFQTLEEVIDFYSDGIKTSPNRDPVMVAEFPNGIGMTDAEKADLLAFLRTLNDYDFIQDERYSNPFD